MKIILYAVFFSLLLNPLKAQEEVPVVILGSGVGALTSAVYLCRAGIHPIVITGPVLGGTITQSHAVENWPGEPSISGIELSEKVKKQAELNGAQLEAEEVVSVDFSSRPLLVTTKQIFSSKLKTYKARSVIIALGATPNLLHIPGEETYWSNGVYNCAVCDGPQYKGQEVTIVGGGDSALLEAQYLAQICAKVHILLRSDHFRASEKQRLQEVLALPNVQVHYKTQVREILGDDEKVNSLLIDSSGQQKELKTDALFLAIGAKPNTELFRNQIELDSEGYIVLKKHQQTSNESVFAIGDVADPLFKQAISAAGDAAKAAMQAQQYLASYTNPKPAATNPIHTEVIEIQSKQHFAKEIQSATGPIFVDFYSTYCGPCRTFSPIYAQWAQQYGHTIKFLKINSDHNQQLFRDYKIRAVPTLLIFDNKGNVVQKSIGFQEIAQIDTKLKNLKDKENPQSQDFK